MGPCIDGSKDRLLELGYTPGTVRGLLKEGSRAGLAEEGRLELSDIAWRRGRSWCGARFAAKILFFPPWDVGETLGGMWAKRWAPICACPASRPVGSGNGTLPPLHR